MNMKAKQINFSGKIVVFLELTKRNAQTWDAVILHPKSRESPGVITSMTLTTAQLRNQMTSRQRQPRLQVKKFQTG